MTIHVEIPEPLAGKVEQAAKQQGKSAQDVVLDAVAKKVDPFARLSGTNGSGMRASGRTGRNGG